MGFWCNLFVDTTMCHGGTCGNEGADVSARDTSLQNIHCLFCIVILELPSVSVFWSNGKMAGFIPESVRCTKWHWWCTCRGLLFMLWLPNCKWQCQSDTHSYLQSRNPPHQVCTLLHINTYIALNLLLVSGKESHYEKLVSSLINGRWTWTDSACDTPINPLLQTLESCR